MPSAGWSQVHTALYRWTCPPPTQRVPARWRGARCHRPRQDCQGHFLSFPFSTCGHGIAFVDFKVTGTCDKCLTKPVVDSTRTVKCILPVKLILPRNETQNDLRMTLTFVIIFASFFSVHNNKFDHTSLFDLKNDRSSLKYFTVVVILEEKLI